MCYLSWSVLTKYISGFQQYSHSFVVKLRRQVFKHFLLYLFFFLNGSNEYLSKSNSWSQGITEWLSRDILTIFVEDGIQILQEKVLGSLILLWITWLSLAYFRIRSLSSLAHVTPSDQDGTGSWLTIRAPRAHCWLLFNLTPTRALDLFL